MEKQSSVISIENKEQDYKIFSGIAMRQFCGRITILSILAGVISIITAGQISRIVFEVFPEFTDHFLHPQKHGFMLLTVWILTAYFIMLLIRKFLFGANKVPYVLPEGSFLRAKTMTIDDKGIHEESAFSKSFTGWHDILRIEDHKEMILFFVDTLAAYVVAKHNFSSKEEEQNFLKQAQTYWKEARNPPVEKSKNPWSVPRTFPSEDTREETRHEGVVS